MSRYNLNNVEKFLWDLQNINPAIKGVSLLSIEGLPIASTLPKETNKNRISALSATLLAVGKRGNKEINNGEFNHLFIEGSNGGILIFQLSKFEILVLIVKMNTSLKEILVSLNKFKFEGHLLFQLD